MTAQWCDVSGVINALVDLSQKALVFRHEDESNRPHYHVYLFGTSRKEDTIRNMVKKVNWAQKEDWSLRNYAGSKKDKLPITIAGAAKYGSKGKYDPTIVKDIQSETIALGKSLGYCKGAVTEKVEEPVQKMKRLTKLDLVAMIDDEIRSNDWNADNTYPHSWYTDKVSNVLVREHQGFSLYKAIDLYEIWMMYHDRPRWNRYAADILDRRYCR